MSNKYHYDLKNVHYAKGEKQEDGTIRYMSPVRIPGAMSMDISAEGDTTKIRADGTDYLVINSNNGYSGNLTLVQTPDEFKKDCLAEQIDQINGIQYEDANAEPGIFALLFEFVGDQKNKRHAFYNCVAKRPGVKGENKDNQKEPDTEEVELTVSPAMFLVGGEEKSIVKASSTPDTKKEVYDSWFAQVIIPGETPEKNAKLSSLTIGSLALTPEFSENVFAYTATTANATNTIKAAPVYAGATVEIKNGDTVIQNGAAATWTDGANNITVKVTNGEAQETYTVTVTKEV